jgi:hypothetical protein
MPDTCVQNRREGASRRSYSVNRPDCPGGHMDWARLLSRVRWCARTGASAAAGEFMIQSVQASGGCRIHGITELMGCGRDEARGTN